MYFTDKFPKSDLKMLHPGLIKKSPGRRLPEIHKNITSNDFMFLSKVYSENIFAKHEPISTIKPNFESISQMTKLQLEIHEKERKIKEMETLLELKLKNEAKQLGITAGFTNTYQNFNEEYSKDLQVQIKEHEEKKIKEKIQKLEEVKNR